MSATRSRIPRTQDRRSRSTVVFGWQVDAPAALPVRLDLGVRAMRGAHVVNVR